MSESRAAHRHRVLKAGAIEFSGGGAISCAVKNLSASGAALEVVSALDIPDRLVLSIPAEHFRRHEEVSLVGGFGQAWPKKAEPFRWKIAAEGVDKPRAPSIRRRRQSVFRCARRRDSAA